MHSNCLICNSTKLKELNHYQKFHLVKCSSCDFVFCKQIPTNDELITHYKTYSRGGAISPITIKRYNEILDSFEKERKTNNILDIGCGDAYFLEVAKQRGWNAYGTEYTDEAVELCKKKEIHIHQGKLDSTNYSNVEFDVITSFEVIEHINNPKEELSHIQKILRPNGIIYLTTPNFNSISRYLLGAKWNVIEYPEHLSYYTPKTIKTLFSQNGFSKQKCETTGISLSRLNQSIGNASQNSDESLRVKSEGRNVYGFLKWAVNSFLKITFLGDNLKIQFRKN